MIFKCRCCFRWQLHDTSLYTYILSVALLLLSVFLSLQLLCYATAFFFTLLLVWLLFFIPWSQSLAEELFFSFSIFFCEEKGSDLF